MLGALETGLLVGNRAVITGDRVNGGCVGGRVPLQFLTFTGKSQKEVAGLNKRPGVQLASVITELLEQMTYLVQSVGLAWKPNETPAQRFVAPAVWRAHKVPRVKNRKAYYIIFTPLYRIVHAATYIGLGNVSCKGNKGKSSLKYMDSVNLGCSL